MPGRHLLVAVYDYPPSTSVGGIRWLTMKKYLERMGHEVTVLTTDAYGHLPTDAIERIVRVPDLVTSEKLRGILRRPALPRPGEQVSVDTAPPALLTSVFVPDIYAVSWVPSAIRAMRRLVREQQINALITTSPKDSTQLIGLARPRRLAWIADFRDGWVFESTRPPLPTRFQRALDRSLESWVVHRADAVVAFSDVLAEDFERRLGRQAHYVSNGFDPELAANDGSGEPLPEPLSRPRVRLVYTGTLTGAEGAPTDRSPVALLEALEQLADENPDMARRIDLVIIGRRTKRDEAILSRFEQLGLIRHLGYVPRATSVAIQRSADVLVLVSGTTPSSIPLKLFEYLAAGRPILHLGHPGAAERLVKETHTGITVSYGDREGMVEQLRRIARDEFGDSFTPTDLDRYSYPHVAERMAEVIEEAVASARARR